MRKILYMAIVAGALLLHGCAPSTVTQEEDLFRYHNSYVGDNGAVGNITRRLPKPAGEQMSGIELQTTEEPYGMILNYAQAKISEEHIMDYSELALFNASYVLALVHNADWVTFNFVEDTITVTREKLQQLYQKDIREFQNDEELSTFIQPILADERKVAAFFA
jgi:hypothetical protein